MPRRALNHFLVELLDSRLLFSAAVSPQQRISQATALHLGGYNLVALSRPPVLQTKALTQTAVQPTLAPASTTPLVAPTITFSSADALQIRISGTAASGGSGTYTYQWHRSTTPGFTPNADNVIANATSLALTDSSAQPDVPYFYILEADDGTSAAFSNQAMGALLLQTAPVAFPYETSSVVIGYLGSSTWAINTGSGQVPQLVDQDLHTAYPQASFTTINGASSGTGTANFLPGQPLSNALKSAMQSASGYKVLRMMIGSNDARNGMPVSTWLANMSAIINDALTWPVDEIVLEEIGIRMDGGNSTLNLIRQYNAARSSLLGPKVVLGTSFTFENQADHLNWLGGDNIHQTTTGQMNLAANQAAEFASLFTVPAVPLTASSPVTDSTGTQITVTLSESACTPGTGVGGFVLSGTSATVTSWTISGTTLTLTLDNRILKGQVVTLSGLSGALQDAAGTPMTAFSALTITNNSELGSIRSGLRVQLS
jgi:hypothetical protein